LHHCWEKLEHDEKWKNHESELHNNKRKNKSSIGDATNVDCDRASSDEGSPTPNSIAKTKRLDGRKFAKEMMKGKKSADDDICKSLDVLMNAHKQMDERKEAMKIKEMKELKETVVRKVVAVEKRVAIERRMEMEEIKIAMEES
jgi:hypothetical protein